MTVGIDEAGRGCWAGPLVAAAVILAGPINGLRDSKQLTKAARGRLAEQIKLQAAAYGLGWVTAAEIDRLGLTAATSQAMSRALAAINLPYQEIIIDGNINYLPDQPSVRCLIKADVTEPAVSAASILAKTARDEFMYQAAKQFPAYQFDKHVGYGTALHRQLLITHGVCELHRLSYKPVKNLLI